MQLCLLQSESQLHFGECGTWKPYKPLQASNTIRLISQTGSIFISILILSQFETSFEYNINLVFLSIQPNKRHIVQWLFPFTFYFPLPSKALVWQTQCKKTKLKSKICRLSTSLLKTDGVFGDGNHWSVETCFNFRQHNFNSWNFVIGWVLIGFCCLASMSGSF